MNNTPMYVGTGLADQPGPGIVRLCAQSSRDEVALAELPIAVGFGSPVELLPRRLTVVPGLAVGFVGSPGPGRSGRVIALPLGTVDRDDTPARSGPTSSGSSPTIERPESEPLRLTTRGRVALLVAAAVVGLAVVVSAWFGAGSATPPARSAAPAQVVVHDGDTLWSIAGRIAPNRDPRAIVDQLLRINQLDTPALVPGQVLRTH
jgi:hypothetical protein